MSATKGGSQERKRQKPEDYIFGKMIGEGSFSCVFLARSANSSASSGKFNEYAIKVCEKLKIQRESKVEYVHREKDILSTITAHFDPKVPFFVELKATFQDALNVYFVMTFAKNGDLLKFIDKMAERDIDCVQFYAAELLSAVEFLHFKVGVIHRDLKPENILLTHKMHILITDFGSAKFLKDKYNINNNRNAAAVAGSKHITPVNDDSETDSDVEEARKGLAATSLSASSSTSSSSSSAAAGPSRRAAGGGGGSHRRSADQDDGVSDELPPRPASKRRSFVGTAQYVSPEILTSRGSSRASDLWAIGCIIYQMITGLPPFQSPSEWLIFKKIEKLDYNFQEGFNEEAKDIIQRLLVIEPRDRLGARDKKCYSSLKRHPFFKGVDFETLPEFTPPALSEAPELVDSGIGPDPCWSKDPDAKPGAGRLHNLMLRDAGCDSSGSDSDGGGGLSCSPVGIQILGHRAAVGGGGGGSARPASASHSQALSDSYVATTAAARSCPAATADQNADDIRKRWTKNHVLQSQNISESERLVIMSDQKSNKFNRFVEGNLIIKQGILDKKKGLLARRRMFLLTEGPRLYYVDPDRMVLKGQVPLTKFVKMEIRDPRIFFLHTPGRIYYLLDPKSNAQEWIVAIEDVTKRYFSSTDAPGGSGNGGGPSSSSGTATPPSAVVAGTATPPSSAAAAVTGINHA